MTACIRAGNRCGVDRGTLTGRDPVPWPPALSEIVADGIGEVGFFAPGVHHSGPRRFGEVDHQPTALVVDVVDLEFLAEHPLHRGPVGSGHLEVERPGDRGAERDRHQHDDPVPLATGRRPPGGDDVDQMRSAGIVEHPGTERHREGDRVVRLGPRSR